MSIASRAAKSITWTFDTTVNPDYDIIRERVLEDAGGSWTGRSVTVDKAHGFVPVMAAIRLRAETIGSLPLPIFRRLPKGKQSAPNHRLYSLLHDQANPEMSAMVFKETLQSHADSWGTGYAEIEFDTDDFPMWLWPLRPDSMEWFRENGKLFALYTHRDGTRSKLKSKQVFRLPGLGSNGITGYGPIDMARQALALGLAAEEFAGRFYSNDARPGIALKLGPEFDYDDDAKKRLAESFDATHAGLKNKHRTAVLDEGMSIEQIGFPADAAQLIEQQKWSVEQVCRIFNIPPHMLHSLERATFNNIEELGLNFVTYSLRPWLVRWEQQIKMQLLVDDPSHFAEFNVDGLLRGKVEDRMKANWSMFQMGAITPNEIRARENMNFRDDPSGDSFYVPVNIASVSEEDEEPVLSGAFPPLQLATRSTKAVPPKVVDKYTPLFEDVTRNLIDLERRMVMREAEKRLAESQTEATKTMVEALTDIAARPIPAPQITMAEGMVKVDMHPGEAPNITVNVPKQPPAQVTMNLPEPRLIHKQIKRDADNNITEIVEVPG